MRHPIAPPLLNGPSCEWLSRWPEHLAQHLAHSWDVQDHRLICGRIISCLMWSGYPLVSRPTIRPTSIPSRIQLIGQTRLGSEFIQYLLSRDRILIALRGDRFGSKRFLNARNRLTCLCSSPNASNARIVRGQKDSIIDRRNFISAFGCQWCFLGGVPVPLRRVGLPPHDVLAQVAIDRFLDELGPRSKTPFQPRPLQNGLFSVR